MGVCGRLREGSSEREREVRGGSDVWRAILPPLFVTKSDVTYHDVSVRMCVREREREIKRERGSERESIARLT